MHWPGWPPRGARSGCATVHRGVDTLAAKNFAICAEVNTGSWLGRTHHGQGIGTEMRAAVLELGFAHLGANSAVSGAFEDNQGSGGMPAALRHPKVSRFTLRQC